MKDDIMKQLDSELAHAGEETQLSPAMLLLEQLRITPEKELPPMEFLFRMFGKPCFPRRELVAITGKAKSGKTFVTSMLMACCITRKVLALKRHTDLADSTDIKPLRMLWYDTEQSDESTQDILKNRVLRMVGHTDLTDHTDKMRDLWSAEESVESVRSVRGKKTTSESVRSVCDYIDVFNVRAVEWKQRRALLSEAITRCKPDLVIVDGIRDLVNDINDGVLAQEVMEELMHLATAENCCIVCVLHQNKSGEERNLRGWIGTELMNKAFEVYACEKMMPQRIFKLEQTLTRKYDIEQTMYFEVGEDGLPRESAVPVEGNANVSSAISKERLPQLNAEYIVHDDSVQGGWQFDVMRLFLDAMRGEEEVGGKELRERVMQLSGIVVPFKYNTLLDEALAQKVIEKSMRDGRSIYRPAPF